MGVFRSMDQRTPHQEVGAVLIIWKRGSEGKPFFRILERRQSLGEYRTSHWFAACRPADRSAQNGNTDTCGVAIPYEWRIVKRKSLLRRRLTTWQTSIRRAHATDRRSTTDVNESANGENGRASIARQFVARRGFLPWPK